MQNSNKLISIMLSHMSLVLCEYSQFSNTYHHQFKTYYLTEMQHTGCVIPVAVITVYLHSAISKVNDHNINMLDTFNNGLDSSGCHKTVETA